MNKDMKYTLKKALDIAFVGARFLFFKNSIKEKKDEIWNTMNHKFNEEDKAKYQIDKLFKHHERADKKIFYSIQRIDLLVIAISTSGIIFNSQVFVYLNDNMKCLLGWPVSQLIAFSSLLYLLAIISNFFSQVTGGKANKYEREWANLELKKHITDKENDVLTQKQVESDLKNDFWHKWTLRLNATSFITMLVGLIFSGVIILIILL